MKRMICFSLAVLLFLLGGCARQEPKPVATEPSAQVTTEATTEAPTTEPTAPPTTTEPYIPEITPDVVGIYIPAGDGTRARTLITEFSGKRTAKTDIDCFEIFASDEPKLDGNSFRDMWNAAWDAYEGAENPKIGFHITFQLPGGDEFSKQLLKPSDSADFFDFIEIYMYDDIHQAPGAWYTHLSDGDMKAETVISSIKLTAGSRISEVGDIRLTAFIYDGEDCFNAAGEYIGLVSQTVLITETE